MTDEAWARAIERELGEKTAEARAQRDEIKRIAEAMDKGFDRLEEHSAEQAAKLENRMLEQINHVRGEIKTVVDHIDERFSAIEADATKTRRTLRALLIGIGVLLSLLQGAQMFVNAPLADAAMRLIP